MSRMKELEMTLAESSEAGFDLARTERVRARQMRRWLVVVSTAWIAHSIATIALLLVLMGGGAS